MSRPKKVCTLVVPQLTRPLLLLGILKKYGAEGGTRTPTGYPTRPSNVRVYQFRHFGSFRKDVKNQQGSGAGYLLGCGDGTIDRKSTRLNSSHQLISYAVFCL